jgi:hypothetical protein
MKFTSFFFSFIFSLFFLFFSKNTFIYGSLPSNKKRKKQKGKILICMKQTIDKNRKEKKRKSPRLYSILRSPPTIHNRNIAFGECDTSL